jgi:hypothetical protein
MYSPHTACGIGFNIIVPPKYLTMLCWVPSGLSKYTVMVSVETKVEPATACMGIEKKVGGVEPSGGSKGVVEGVGVVESLTNVAAVSAKSDSIVQLKVPALELQIEEGPESGNVEVVALLEEDDAAGATVGWDIPDERTNFNCAAVSSAVVVGPGVLTMS